MQYSLYEAVTEYSQDDNKPNKDGIIKNIELAFEDDPIGKKVAYMVANSHEYKDNPNVEAGIKFAKNYTWVETTMPVKNIEGIDKPVIQSKVFEIAKSIGKAGNNKYPLVVVDKFHGIKPQSPGKYLLFDGNHRKAALVLTEIPQTSVYKGKYTGDAELSLSDLLVSPEEKSSLTESSHKVLDKIELSPSERSAVKAKYGKIECSFFKTKDGKYYCTTHRARSKFYDSPTDIPIRMVKFISSTS